MIGAVPDDRRCIVVGAGLLGLSAAWALTRRGWQVLVLEAAGAPGHERSGSKGDARIFRLGYPEPHYVEMACWPATAGATSRRATGRRLLHVTGQVTLGDEATLDAIAARWRRRRCARRAGLGRRRRRGAFPGSQPRARARRARVGRAGRRRSACARCARRVTSSCAPGRRVTSLRQSPDAVAVTTADGAVLEADIVVVCAGRPPSALARPRARAVAAAPSLPQVAYFAPAAGREGVAPPVFIEWGDDMVYGLPVPGGGPHAGTYKVSHHTPGPILDGLRPDRPRPVRRRRPGAPGAR